jgi:hypothetical protein
MPYDVDSMPDPPLVLPPSWKPGDWLLPEPGSNQMVPGLLGSNRNFARMIDLPEAEAEAGEGSLAFPDMGEGRFVEAEPANMEPREDSTESDMHEAEQGAQNADGRSILMADAGIPDTVAKENTPVSNLIPHDDRSYKGVAKGAYPDWWDPIVDREVAAYNDAHVFELGNRAYLDPALIKAMIRVESGFDMKAYRDDPMQVNNSTKTIRRDWDEKKAKFGLEKGVAPGPAKGIRAGIQWLNYKAYLHGDNGKPVKFLGWDSAVKAYNGRGTGAGNPNYVSDVKKQLQILK